MNSNKETQPVLSEFLVQMIGISRLSKWTKKAITCLTEVVHPLLNEFSVRIVVRLSTKEVHAIFNMCAAKMCRMCRLDEPNGDVQVVKVHRFDETISISPKCVDFVQHKMKSKLSPWRSCQNYYLRRFVDKYRRKSHRKFTRKNWRKTLENRTARKLSLYEILNFHWVAPKIRLLRILGWNKHARE